MFVPHIFVWGSCFCFCIPSAPPPVLLRRLRHLLSHTHNFVTHHLCHTQLCHTPLCDTPLCHIQLCHMQLCHALGRHPLVFRVAGVALTSTFVLRGRRGTWGTGLALEWLGTEALAGQFTSSRLSNVPPCSPLRRFGGRLSHEQLWHTQLLHAQLFYTQLSHTQLVHTHTQLFPTSSHTTLPHTIFFNLSILHHLLCLSFLLCPASTLVSNYWKKLTCGVIRSFNFPIQRQFLAPCFPRIFRIRRLMVIVSTISPAVNLLCNQLRDSNKYRAPYFPMYPYTIPYISLQHHIFFFAPHDFVGQLPTTPLLISSSIKSQFSVG